MSSIDVIDGWDECDHDSIFTFRISILELQVSFIWKARSVKIYLSSFMNNCLLLNYFDF